jgi:aldehyde:ferredoxin oxidoreductase
MRAVNGMSLAYAISPHYGGSHNSCDMYMNALGIGAEDLGIIPTEAKENSPLIAETAARVMCHRAFYSSAIMCVFSNPPAATLGKYIELATGMKMDINAIRLMGERILDIKRLFNLKMGHTPKDEHIPKILLTPLPESGQAGNVPDFESLKTTFYKFLQWDLITGKPSVKKVEELGLQKFA